MTRNYCTIFDTNYAAFGLTLFSSLKTHESDFRLYVLCFDDNIFKVLTELNHEGLIPIRREGFYDEIYEQVANKMNYGQKCWLAQPLFCEWLLKEQGLDHVIYMDSDCFFFSSPAPLLKEIEEHGPTAATVVSHNFSPSVKLLAERAGRYCVQFNYFAATPESFAVLNRWKADCLKYRKEDPWIYPGQLSLNEWARVSDRVYEIRNEGAGVAVWNLENHDWSQKRVPIIFYHFHGLCFPSQNLFDLGNYRISKEVVDQIYKPYLREFDKQNQALESRFPGMKFIRQTHGGEVSMLRRVVRIVKRRIRGTYSVFTRSQLLGPNFHKEKKII